VLKHVLSSAVLMCGSTAQADVFFFSYSGANVSEVGTLTANNIGSGGLRSFECDRDPQRKGRQRFARWHFLLRLGWSLVRRRRHRFHYQRILRRGYRGVRPESISGNNGRCPMVNDHIQDFFGHP
jgi:hypothetical protein